MADLVTTLRSGQVLIMDGAMGTELQRRTQTLTTDSAGFNLTDPALVRAIHRSYLEAGAEVLVTNTFQASPADDAIWQAALRLAREANPRFVLAGVGPVEYLTADRARAIAEQCRTADGLLLETWTSLADLDLFSNVDRPPLLVSFTYHHVAGKLQTFAGAEPEACARAARAAGAVAVGANCGKDIDMIDMAELARRYRAVCTLPIFMRPNAGTPILKGSTWLYPQSVETMIMGLPALLDAGATMVGGCCGTTPEHIGAFHEFVVARRFALS